MLLPINIYFIESVINNRPKEKRRQKAVFFLWDNCIRRDSKGRKENLSGKGFPPVEPLSDKKSAAIA